MAAPEQHSGDRPVDDATDHGDAAPPDADRHAEDPDAALVAAAREGDDTAFETLVRRHTPRCYRVAYHLLGNTADADECVQDAWVSVWRHLSGYQGTAALTTWLYRVTTNAALMHLRRRHPTVGLDQVPEPADPAPYGDPERRAAAAAVRRALAGLRPEYRAVIVLREFEGLRYDELAAALDVSVPTVRSRLQRARVDLTRLLEDWR